MKIEQCREYLKNFLSPDGKLKQWPTKRKLQIVGLCFCHNFFEDNREYIEKEVNEILTSIHTFGDYCMLRRDLCDMKFLARTDDNRKYWKLSTPNLAAFGL